MSMPARFLRRERLRIGRQGQLEPVVVEVLHDALAEVDIRCLRPCDDLVVEVLVLTYGGRRAGVGVLRQFCI